MPYEYDNKDFSSIKALSEYTGINEKTLTARLRRGMSLEDACKKTDFRCTYFMEEGAEKSIAEICADNEKNQELVRNRLKYGYSMQDALNKPKNVTKQGHPIVLEGILYNSIAAAIRKYNLQSKASTIHRRIGEGRSPTQVFQEILSE